MTQTTLKDFLQDLNKNHRILKEREAKYATAAPLSLLNQLDDYEKAITLTRAAIREGIPLPDLQSQFSTLNLEISTVVFIAQEPPRKPFTGQNPYRGLRKFTENEADYFFGRTAAVEHLLTMLDFLVQAETSPHLPDLVAVLGPSGSGKSSLVRAGVIPALRQGEIKGSENWPIKVMVPGAHPLDELAAQFIDTTGRGLASLRADLDTGSHALHQLMIESLLGQPDEAIFVLVIDQFEELFTLTQSQEERQSFLDLLLHVSQVRHNRGFIILTMRADYYAKAADYKRLAEIITFNQMLVSPMTEKELREAILLPAEAVGLELEKALVETLLNDTADAPGILPLLQHTLTELFHKRNGNLLTLEAYKEIGAVQGALAHRADAILESLSHEQKQIVRHIFLRLTHIDESVHVTRHRATFEEILTKNSQATEVESIIQILVEANLIVTDQGKEETQMVLDVAHEALLQAWPRFQTWLQSNRHSLQIRQQLSLAAQDWENRDRHRDSLYRGARLLEIEEWAAANPETINPLEQTFIEASIIDREEAEIRRKRRTQQIIATLSIAFILALLAAIFGIREWQRASIANATSQANLTFAQTEQAIANQLKYVAQTERALASQGQAAAVIIAQTAETDKEIAIEKEETAIAAEDAAENKYEEALARQLALESSVSRHNWPQRSLLLAIEAVSTTLQVNGLHVVIAEESLRESLSNMGGIPLLGHNGKILEIAISPNSRWLITGGQDNATQLWDLHNLNNMPRSLPAHYQNINSIAISPDNQWLVIGNKSKTTHLWNLNNLIAPPQELSADSGPLSNLSFSPNNRWFFVGSGTHTATLWNMTSLTPISLNTAEHTQNLQVAFSPNNRWLVTIANNTARLWPLDSLDNNLSAFTELNQSSIGLKFDDNSQNLLLATLDGTIQQWNLANPNSPATILAQLNIALSSAQFSPNNRWLLTRSENDTDTLLWDLTNPNNPIISPNVLLNDSKHSAAFSEDNHWLAMASQNNTILLWNLTAPNAPPTPLRGHEGAISNLAFTPDNQWLVSSGTDGVARLWPLNMLNQASLIRTAGGPIPENCDCETATSVVFSADRRWLVSGGWDGIPRVWQMSNFRAPPIPLAGHSDSISALAFSPDARWLATASFDGIVQVWDSTNFNIPARPLVGHHPGPIKLVFSPDNQWLVTTGPITTLVWDLKTASASPFPLAPNAPTINHVAFSLDNRWLAAGGDNRFLRVWDVSNLNAPLTVPFEEMSPVNPMGEAFSIAFSPDGQRLVVGRQGGVRMWDTHTFLPINGFSGLIGDIGVTVFSPDNHWLASVSDEKTLLLWDLSTPNSPPLPLNTQGARITTVAFSPNNRWLASPGADKDIYLWDLNDLDDNPVTLKGHNSAITDLAFSPDGDWLVSGSDDGTARLWQMQMEELLNVACRTVNRNFTQEEWEDLSRQGLYRPTCANWPIHPSVFEEAQEAAKEGDIQEAIAQFQHILSLDPSLNFNPEAEVNRVLEKEINNLLEAGETLVSSGKISEAILKFEAALNLDPTLGFSPAGQAYNLAQSSAQEDIKAAEALAKSGDIVQALLKFEEIQTLDSNSDIQIPAEAWHTLCFAGVKWEQASLVLKACNQAITLDPENGLFYNSRGFARLQIGDTSGAREDFAIFEEWLELNERMGE